MAKTISIDELRRALRRERQRLLEARVKDFRASRINFSAETHDALSRVLLLEDLVEGALELEG